MKTIFDVCSPRKDIEQGRLRDEELAADLAAVVSGTAAREYLEPPLFFQHTHPTRGLCALLETVCRRLSGQGGELNSVVRLDTQFGGGKTHGLIALVHAVRGMQGVASPREFINPSLLPKGEVRVAALDGENSDPANGVLLESGLKARSLWGEMAYRLAGREGYERVRKSDEAHVAPGTQTIVELFGGKPTLILIDEIALYLRKVAPVFPQATNQFAAFAQSLYKAVASTPQVCLVLTLAVRSEDKQATDAYRAEQQIAMQAFDEAESVTGRKATQLNPTEEDETVAVIRRRLFERVDDAGAAVIIESYASVWNRNKDSLHADAGGHETRELFRAGYPLHPETLSTLIEKTSTLSNFHRIRGMLRILARTVHHLWKDRPADAFAIHPHHINPGFPAIRDEFTTKLQQGAYAPALAADIAAVPGAQPATAQQLDQAHYPGQPPVTSYVARTIFLHTLAYPESAQGITPDRLRYAVCSPAIEPSFVEAARRRFVGESLYLDDRPGAPLRFLTEANLNQMIRKAVSLVDPAEVRSNLNERIKDVFRTQSDGFELVAFPAGPYEVPDELGDGRPYLVVLGYDAFSVSDELTSLPNEIVRMATRKGAAEELRKLQNNFVFVVADDRLREEMRQAVRYRLAVETLRRPEHIASLAEHQQRKLNESYEKSPFQIAESIMHCYRHLFYPSHVAIGSGEAQLAHSAVEVANASDKPGNGQLHVKRAMKEQKKLLSSGDPPDAPTYVRDNTPLKTKGQITTLDLRNEYRKAPKLSILLDNEPLIRCVRDGIDQEAFIYRDGDLVWGKGDPSPSVRISENAFVHTLANAKELGLWPRRPKPAEFEEGPTPPGSGREPVFGPTPMVSPPLAPADLDAEGPLQQALTELFEKARQRGVGAFTEIRIKLFGAKEAWNVHQAVATYPEAEARVTFKVDVSGDGIDAFHLGFRGTMARFNSVKSFLDPQLRTSTAQNFEGEYSLTFKQPLLTREDRAEAFTKSMTKYGGGEAYIEARAAATEEA